MKPHLSLQQYLLAITALAICVLAAGHTNLRWFFAVPFILVTAAFLRTRVRLGRGDARDASSDIGR